MKLYEVKYPTALTEEQLKWMRENLQGFAKLGEDGEELKIVKGRVNLTKILVRVFNEVTVDVPFGKVRAFHIEKNPKIKDCTNFPTSCTLTATITDTNLETLEGFPQVIQESIDLRRNKIKSLKGIQEEMKGSITLSDNQLTSLEYCPKKIGGGFAVSTNKITNLDYVPEHIQRNFYISDNELTTLSGLHKKLKYCGGKIYIGGNPITGGILSPLMIEGCKGLASTPIKKTTSDELEKAVDIVNKYFGKGRKGMLDAQTELMDNDLDDFAEL